MNLSRINKRNDELKKMKNIIELDGSHGEGGGQILRTALALSILTQKPFKINNIRKGRCTPGLKPQHLSCVKAIQQITHSKAVGAEVGSESLEFMPAPINNNKIEIDIGTAGSVTLVLQSILLPLMFSKKNVNIKIIGGTDVKWSMSSDYLKEIFLPHLQKFAKIECKITKRGYYPKGCGVMELKIMPIIKSEDYADLRDKLKSFEQKIDLTERGVLMQIKGVSHASIELEDAKVAQRQADSAKNALQKLGVPINIQTSYSKTDCAGSSIFLKAVYANKSGDIDIKNPVALGDNALGEKGTSSEIVGKTAADNLLKQIMREEPVDEYLEDNLIPCLALFGGVIKASNITDHTASNIYVCEKFLDVKFEIENGFIEVKK